MPSPVGPQRPDPAHGSSRHTHRAEPETVEQDGPDDGAWFAVVLRGYDRGQVDARLADLDHRIHTEIRRAESAEHARDAARAQVRRLQAQVDAASAGSAVAQRRGDEAGFGRSVERVLQAAEQEAAELRERATAEAEQIVARARDEAEDRRARTEEALLGRAATLDREFASRRAELDERADSHDARDRDLTERERAVAERIGSARGEADGILDAARADAAEILAAARDEAATAVRDAERDAGEARAGTARDVARLATLRDEVREELTRVRASLTAELDREPVSATLDDALFGPTSSVLDGGSGPDATPAATDTDPVASVSDLGADGPAAGGDSRDSGDADTATGTLLLGPGRRPADDDPDSTTVGQIPPITLSSIGVLPFGDLGSGRDGPRSRADGAGGTARAHRGPTRGPGPGRRSR